VAFYRDTKDGIDFSYADYRYFNNNRQKDHGAELEAAYRSATWNFSAAYSHVTGMVNTMTYRTDPNTFETVPYGDTTYNNLFRRPKHNLVLQAGWRPLPRGFVSLTGRFTGKRYEPQFAAGPIEMTAYQVTDLFVSWETNAHVRFFLDLRNVFNTKYEDVRGFNTKGRNLMAGVRLNW
jgi:vitamin B12 transporter